MRILYHPTVNACCFASLNAFRLRWCSFAEHERAVRAQEAAAWLASLLCANTRYRVRMNRTSLALMLNNVCLN